VVDPNREDHGEDRRRCHEDPRQRRGDLLLTERDQQERSGGLDRGDQGHDPELASHAAKRTPPSGERNKHGGGKQHPQEGDGRG
jgi:hypothetical protein